MQLQTRDDVPAPRQVNAPPSGDIALRYPNMVSSRTWWHGMWLPHVVGPSLLGLVELIWCWHKSTPLDGALLERHPLRVLGICIKTVIILQ